MSWALIISGIILLVIGIIMVIVGIVLYEQNVKANKAQPWYVWLLLIGGIILAIVGGVLLAWGLIARSNASANTTTTTTVYQPLPQAPPATSTVVTGQVCPPQVQYIKVPVQATSPCGTMAPCSMQGVPVESTVY